MSECCQTRIIQVMSGGGPYTVEYNVPSPGIIRVTDDTSNNSFELDVSNIIDLCNLSAAEITCITQAIDFTQLTNTQVTNLSQIIDLSQLTATQITNLQNVLNPLFTVNAGTTASSSDNANGEQDVNFGDILHFWSQDGTILFNVSAGSAVVEARLNPTVISGIAHTSITNINLRPHDTNGDGTGTIIPNQYVVDITWVDENGTTNITTDPTPVLIEGIETVTTLDAITVDSTTDPYNVEVTIQYNNEDATQVARSFTIPIANSNGLTFTNRLTSAMTDGLTQTLPDGTVVNAYLSANEQHRMLSYAPGKGETWDSFLTASGQTAISYVALGSEGLPTIPTSTDLIPEGWYSVSKVGTNLIVTQMSAQLDSDNDNWDSFMFDESINLIGSGSTRDLAIYQGDDSSPANHNVTLDSSTYPNGSIIVLGSDITGADLTKTVTYQSNSGNFIDPATGLNSTDLILNNQERVTLIKKSDGNWVVTNRYPNYIDEDFQDFQITACDSNEGLIGVKEYEIQLTEHNVINTPLTWQILESNGDIENTSIDVNGLIRYDVPAVFSNNGYANILVEATDSLGYKVVERVCIQLKDPVIKEPLACNGDIEQNLPDLANKFVAFAKPNSNRVFQDLAKTIVSNDGDIVTVLEDSTGNGDLISNNNPPRYLSMDSNINNNPALVFNDANSESIEYQVPSAPAAGSPFKLIALVKPSGNQANATVISSTSVANNNDLGAGTWQFSKFSNLNEFGFRSQSGFTNITVGSISTATSDLIAQTWSYMTDGNYHLLFADYNGTTISVYIDGVLSAQADPIDSLNAEYFKIFENRAGTNFVSGNLAEFIYADQNVSDNEATQIQAYFLCKYGLDSSLISDPGPFSVENFLYDSLSQFEKHTYSDNTERVYDTLNNTYYDINDVPTPNIGFLNSSTNIAILNSVQMENVSTASLDYYDDDIDAITNGSLQAGDLYKTSGNGASPLNIAGLIKEVQ